MCYLVSFFDDQSCHEWRLPTILFAKRVPHLLFQVEIHLLNNFPLWNGRWCAQYLETVGSLVQCLQRLDIWSRRTSLLKTFPQWLFKMWRLLYYGLRLFHELRYEKLLDGLSLRLRYMKCLLVWRYLIFARRLFNISSIDFSFPFHALLRAILVCGLSTSWRIISMLHGKLGSDVRRVAELSVRFSSSGQALFRTLWTYKKP